jgi:hypothetical protein
MLHSAFEADIQSFDSSALMERSLHIKFRAFYQGNISTEFIPYAMKFYSGKQLNVEEELKWKYAWLHHQHKNKHHWEYWVIEPKTNEAFPMPEKYIIEMVCDWRSFSRKWGRRVKESTLDLTDKIVIHPDTKRALETIMMNKKEVRPPQSTEGEAKPFN